MAIELTNDIMIVNSHLIKIAVKNPEQTIPIPLCPVPMSVFHSCGVWGVGVAGFIKRVQSIGI